MQQPQYERKKLDHVYHHSYLFYMQGLLEHENCAPVVSTKE